MICYVITETREKYAEMDCHGVKHTLERCSGEPCLVMHYSQVTRDLMADLDPLALCHSGGVSAHSDYDVLVLEGYRWAIMESDIPQIGFCGGHQVIAEMFGSTVALMRELAEDEIDPNQAYAPGWLKEWGVYPVRVVARDPLFEGLGDTFRVQEYHRCHVDRVPDGFRLLASTDECPVQAFVHEQKPLYGVQFHPEQASESYPDGWRILENFFAIARQTT